MSASAGANARLTRLEEEMAFQEQRLESLNSALVTQQKQLDKMEAGLLHLAERLKNALDALEEAARDSSGPANEKPPHYL